MRRWIHGQRRDLRIAVRRWRRRLMVWWWTLAVRACEVAGSWFATECLDRWERMAVAELTVWASFYSPATDDELAELVSDEMRSK